MARLIALAGLPGVGKSSIAQHLARRCDCQEARDGWEAIGQRTGAKVKWLEVVCSDPVEHRRRIETSSSDIIGLALPDWHAVVLRACDDWNRDHVVVDTAHRNLDVCVDEALDRLRR